MPSVNYEHTYQNALGKMTQVVITDTNDVNCNNLSRSATARTLESVNLDASEEVVLTSRSQDVCLVENPTASEPTCIEWTVSASDQANGYLEMPSGDDLLDNDTDMKCFASVYHNGRYYHLDNTSPTPRDAYKCDRVSSPNRLYFGTGVLRSGLKAILVIMPN